MSTFARVALFSTLVTLTAGCNSAAAPTDAGVTPGLDAPGTDAPTGGDAGGIPSLAVCTEACSAVADCTSAAATLGEDNFACEAGRCRYLGCTGDAECQSTFGPSGGTWVCGTGTPPACVETCTVVADCTSPTATLSEDNFVCEAGRCRYLGCTGDAECQSTFGASGGTWVCGAGTPPSCVETCTTVTDCTSAAATLGEDNFACEAGRCRYLGCSGDAECQSTFGASGGAWVCAS